MAKRSTHPTAKVFRRRRLNRQENHAIAKMTVRCAQYMSALKIAQKQPTNVAQESPPYNPITIQR